MTEPGWQSFDLEDVREKRAAAGGPWLEFIRSPDLYVGLYEIPVGGVDKQSPHAADEVYHVLSGRAVFGPSDGDRARDRRSPGRHGLAPYDQGLDIVEPVDRNVRVLRIGVRWELRRHGIPPGDWAFAACDRNPV